MVPERLKQGQHDAAAAVLLSAGLDSAVLVAHAAARGPVQPLYISVGLAWEREEQLMLGRLFASGRLPQSVLPIITLRFEMRDIYPQDHWAMRGEAPEFDTPDEDVYLEGRNIVLLSKAATFMARHRIERVLIGPLAGNPFPDATPAFFRSMERALALGLDKPISIETPFASLRKSDVIRMGVDLGVPFEHTLSCMQATQGLHCGRCSKCRERRDAFREAGVADPTAYEVEPVR